MNPRRRDTRDPQVDPKYATRPAGLLFPYALIDDKSLTWRERQLLAIIDALDNDTKEGCYATNPYLAEAMGVEPATIKVTICRLISKGDLIRFWKSDKERRHLRWRGSSRPTTRLPK